MTTVYCMLEKVGADDLPKGKGALCLLVADLRIRTSLSSPLRPPPSSAGQCAVARAEEGGVKIVIDAARTLSAMSSRLRLTSKSTAGNHLQLKRLSRCSRKEKGHSGPKKPRWMVTPTPQPACPTRFPLSNGSIDGQSAQTVSLGRLYDRGKSDAAA